MKQEQRYFFAADDASHDYMIPVEKHEEWIEWQNMAYDWETVRGDHLSNIFEDYLTLPTINFSFTKPEMM